MSFCKKCGNRLTDTQKFCPACGTPVEQTAPQSVMYDAPSQQPVYQQAPVYQVPQAPVYQVPQAPAPQQPVKEPVVYAIFSIASLVCGIISLIFSVTFIFAVYGFIIGIPSLVFGAISKKSIKHHGKAKAGFVLSLIAVIIGGVILMISLIVLLATGAAIGGSRYFAMV